MFEYHFYAFFLNRFFFFFAETDVDIGIEIDDEATFVEDCVEMKTIAIVILIKVIVLIKVTILIENDCIKTSTNLKTIVKSFFSRRIDDLLISVTLFF